jgi:HEAT repeat protein
MFLDSIFRPNPKVLEKQKNVKGLIKALCYMKDSNIRKAAARALGNIGDMTALDPLLSALVDTDRYVGEAAEESLRKIVPQWAGTASVRVHVSEFINALGNRSLEDVIRRRAAIYLGKIRDIMALESLVAALKQSEWRVRNAAQEALSNMPDAAIPRLIEALQDSNKDVREGAAYALSHMSNAAKRLVDVLRDQNSKLGTRYRVASALGVMNWETQDATERAWLLTAQRKWDDACAYGGLAVEPLAAALKEVGDDGDKRQIVIALGKLREPKALPYLIEAIKIAKGQDIAAYIAKALKRLNAKVVLQYEPQCFMCHAGTIGPIHSAVVLSESSERTCDRCGEKYTYWTEEHDETVYLKIQRLVVPANYRDAVTNFYFPLNVWAEQ